MDSTLPKFKVGEAASNILQKNNAVTLDDSESLSFVVLAKNGVESSQGSMPNDEQVPQLNLDDQQAILSSVNDISRVENKLHQVLEENEKLKKTLDESDTLMKQQFEKIQAWQKEVITLCRTHSEKYAESKQFIDQMKAENEYLRGLVQNQSTKSVSKSEDDAAESSSLSTSTYLSADIDRSLPQKDSLIEPINTFSIITRDSSLDSNMTVISLKTDKTTQLPAAEMQSASTENQSVTAFIDTHTSAMETQCASNATEMQSTDIHSSLSRSKSLSLANIENNLHKMLEGSKALIEQSKKLTARNEDVMSLCNDQSIKSLCNNPKAELEKLRDLLKANNCSSNVAFESDALHKEKENLTQERESPNKLEKTLRAICFPFHTSYEPKLRVFKDNDAESTLPRIPLSPSQQMLDARLEHDSTAKTVESKLQCVSSESESVTACVETQTLATETQCASTETEAQSTDIATDTFSLDSRTCSEEIRTLKKHASIIAKQVLENGNLTKYVNIAETQCARTETEAQSTNIATYTDFKTSEFDTVPQFTLAISECLEQIGRLEKNAQQFLENGNLTKYVDAYREALKELNNCFSSMRSRCTEEQDFLVAVHQFHKLQLDFSFIINELAIAMVKKEKGNTCDTVVIEKENAKLLAEKLILVEQKIDLMKEKARVHEKVEKIMIGFKTLEQLMLEKETLLLQEKCTELTKKLDERKALYVLKKDLSRARKNLDELNKLLDDRIKSYKEEHQALTKENRLLKNKCDILEVDVKNFNTELIECHNTIKKLRKQIAELREAGDTIDVYKVQNAAQAKDLLRMFDAEQNYLEEIERLSNEIEKLQARLDTNS